MRVGRGVVLALVLGAAPAFGHAILREASIGGPHAVRAETPMAVTLRFNSGIETSFTKVTLVDAAGKTLRTLEVRAGDEQGQVKVELPALAAGSYGLRYKVLAADGHMTESLLRFKVAPAE
jgi:methionine-rich copper-binding protein CopC